MELRLQKEADAIHCYMGVSSLSCAKTLVLLLKQLRCGFHSAEPLSEMSTETLLLRGASETYHIIPGQNRGSTLLMREIVPDAGRSKSLYYTLGQMPEGYGYSVLIRKSPQLDMRTSTAEKYAEQNRMPTCSFMRSCFMQIRGISVSWRFLDRIRKSESSSRWS